MYVLQDTAGYVDSSDYEFQPYGLQDTVNGYGAAGYGRFREGLKSGGHKKAVVNRNHSSYAGANNAHVGGHKAYAGGDFHGEGSYDSDGASAWEAHRSGAKSPRFGRDDAPFSANYIRATNYSKISATDANKAGRPGPQVFNSIETVDSLTPMNEATDFESYSINFSTDGANASSNEESRAGTGPAGQFKWWCNADGAAGSSGESPNACQWAAATAGADSAAHVDETSEDTVTFDADSVAGSLSADGTASPSPAAAEAESAKGLKEAGGVSWKSWTVGGSELEEVRARLVKRLLDRGGKAGSDPSPRGDGDPSPTGTSDPSPSTSSDLHKPKETWDQLAYYRQMNQLLFEKLKLLLGSPGRLEFGLSYEYVASVQSHLLRVHQYLNGVGAAGKLPESGPAVKDEPVAGVALAGVAEQATANSQKTTTDTDSTKELERLKAENEQLKKALSELKLAKLAEEPAGAAGGSEGVEKAAADSAADKSKAEDGPDPEKAALLEKLRVVQQSRADLEEDFRRTLTYMRLMKDRLKMFRAAPRPAAAAPAPATTAGRPSDTAAAAPPRPAFPAGYPGGYGLPGRVGPAQTAVRPPGATSTAPVPASRAFSKPSDPKPKPDSSSKWSTDHSSKLLDPSRADTRNPDPRGLDPPKPTDSPRPDGLPARSSSCVRFKETSELYFVPRSLSENRTILVNNSAASTASSKLNRFFKIFSKN